MINIRAHVKQLKTYPARGEDIHLVTEADRFLTKVNLKSLKAWTYCFLEG